MQRVLDKRLRRYSYLLINSEINALELEKERIAIRQLEKNLHKKIASAENTNEN